MAVAAEPGVRGHAVARRGARARPRLQRRPAAHDVHRRHRDAGVRVPQAPRAQPAVPGVPARVGRARPGRRALLVHRRPPAQGPALEPRRPRRPVRARRRGGRAPPPGAARRTCRRSAAARSGLFGYDLVRTVETTLGRAEPGRDRPARPRADAQRRAGHLRPPQAHGHDPRERLRRATREDVDAAYADALATIAKARALLAGPVPDFGAAPPARAPDVRPRTCRASSSRRWSRGSSSTSTPATRSRSSRRSAGAPTSTSTRSASTAGCGS